MHLAFFAPSPPLLPDDGGDGASVISYHIVQRAKQLGHAVEVFVFGNGQNDIPRSGPALHTLPKPHASLAHSLAWSVRRTPWHLARWYSPAMRTAVERAAQNPAIDLIVLHSPFLAGYLPFAGAKPVVLHAIDALSGWFAQVAQQTRSPLRRWHLQQEARGAASVEKTLYPRSTAIVVVAPADRNVLRVHAPNTTITVIPNGVDVSRCHPSHAPVVTNRIVFTGRLDYPPNVRAVEWFADRVWPRVRQEIPAATWEIVGRSPAAPVRARAKRPGIMLRPDVPSTVSHLQQATAVIVPTFVASGMKNTALEAMACGKAIIATPAGVNGLPVVSGREVLVAYTGRDFTEAVLRVLRNGQLRMQLGIAARAYAEAHTWSRTADAYLALYDQLRAS